MHWGKNVIYLKKVENNNKNKEENDGDVMVVMMTMTILTDAYCCSVAKLCLTLCDPMDCSTAGFHILHYLPEFAHIHIH